LSAGDAILVFLDRHNEVQGWLQLRDAGVAARGTALEGLPPLVDEETRKPVRQVAVVPGEAVSLHWLEVPGGLAPAQAVAAARLIAAEVSVQPLADMHVAVGPEQEGHPLRAVALAPAISMAGWIGRLQPHGIDPDLVIPETLLLPPADEGFVRYHLGDVPLYRGASDAFSIEPELAELVVRDAPVATIDDAAFEAGLARAIADPPVNLRQGAFAKRRRWKIEWKLVRRLALLSLAILLVTLAIQIAAIMRYTLAADALEIEANRIAAAALPSGSRSANAAARLEQRVDELRGSGVGYSGIASTVFSAVQGTPNAALTAVNFDRDGSLRVTAEADSPATISALQQRIAASGLSVEVGPMRTQAGRPAAEMVVRAR